MPPVVICCGLSCVDMELHRCDLPETREAITKFQNVSFTPGGSAPQTARALSALSVSAAVLTVLGDDPHGVTMKQLLQRDGVDTSALITDASTCTSLAVLPLFRNGTRGCFVTLGANNIATVDKLLTPVIQQHTFTHMLKVFHFGYPHLMPNLQAQNLHHLFQRVRQIAPHVILTMDVNGANSPETTLNPVLLPALHLTSALHANLEEACTITALYPASKSSHLTAQQIRPLAQWFSTRGAGIVCITCGKDGVFVATGGSANDHQWPDRLQLSQHLERDCFIYRPAYKISQDVPVNASGAGDAFMAGIISELAANSGACRIARLADAGLLAALHRIDTSLIDSTAKWDIPTLFNLVKDRDRIPCRPSLCPEEYTVAETVS